MGIFGEALHLKVAFSYPECLALKILPLYSATAMLQKPPPKKKQKTPGMSEVEGQTQGVFLYQLFRGQNNSSSWPSNSSIEFLSAMSTIVFARWKKAKSFRNL